MDNSKEIKIRIYKATDNLDACKKFAQGHADVLASYGIKKVTSANTEWFNDSGVYIIMVESPSGHKIYGGARLHLKNKNFLLPIEKAVGNLDSKIFNLIDQYGENRTGELCGLWNTKGMSGTGLSVLLTRVGVAEAGIFMAQKLELESVYILCAPWTVEMVKNVGFNVEESIGKKGTFIYPRPDLLATALVVKDLKTLKGAEDLERQNIFDLRTQPKQIKSEHGPKGKIEVEYDLLVPDFFDTKYDIKNSSNKKSLKPYSLIHA